MKVGGLGHLFTCYVNIRDVYIVYGKTTTGEIQFSRGSLAVIFRDAMLAQLRLAWENKPEIYTPEAKGFHDLYEY